MFPAKRGFLNIWIWVNEDQKPSPMAVIKGVHNRVNAIINRNKGEHLTEIDLVENEGLRVVCCLKSNATVEFDNIKKKYYMESSYVIVASEDEDFSSDKAGDKEWKLRAYY